MELELAVPLQELPLGIRPKDLALFHLLCHGNITLNIQMTLARPFLDALPSSTLGSRKTTEQCGALGFCGSGLSCGSFYNGPSRMIKCPPLSFLLKAFLFKKKIRMVQCAITRSLTTSKLLLN